MHLADLPPLPEAPGVYQWWKGSSIIYVGKDITPNRGRKQVVRPTRYVFGGCVLPIRISLNISGDMR